VEHGRDQQRRILAGLTADPDTVEGEHLLLLFKTKHPVPLFSDPDRPEQKYFNRKGANYCMNYF
jgi:hypothetical protein